MNRVLELLVREPRFNSREFSSVLSGFIRISGLTTALLLVSVALPALFLVPSSHAQGDADVRAAANRKAFQDRIHFGDVVDVDVVGSLEFDWRGGLTPEGFLDGLERADKPVFALCRTENEVAAAIADQYRRVLRNPNIVVRIVDRSKRALAYINGAVKKPQRFQIRRPVSLIELIVLSGGITDSSNGQITIFRPPNVNCRSDIDLVASKDGIAAQNPQQMSLKIADVLSGAPNANPWIASGDIVTVTEASPIFLIGDVAAPRRMNLTPDLTLLRAISAAGGLSRSYSGQKARIHRRDGETKVLEFDLRKIMDKKEDDPKLQAYDVVEVERKGFETRKVAPVVDPRSVGRESLSKLPLRIID